MRITLLTLYFATTFLACKNSKQLTNTNEENPTERIEFIVPQEVPLGGNISFEFINKTSEQITLHSPSNKNIQKFENGNWRKVRILYCPCGADCIPPAKTKTLEAGEMHKYSWNLIESWCDKIVKNKMPKTIERKSPAGLYRIKIIYSTDGITKKEQIKEFKIID